MTIIHIVCTVHVFPHPLWAEQKPLNNIFVYLYRSFIDSEQHSDSIYLNNLFFQNSGITFLLTNYHISRLLRLDQLCSISFYPCFYYIIIILF